MNDNASASWKLETDAEGIAWLTLDKPGTSANVLSGSVLSELDALLAPLEQQPPRDTKSFAHIATVVHVRVVDEPFPSHGRARLFEVHAHDEQQRGFDLRRQPPETGRILARRHHIMYRTGTHHHEQARIAALQYRAYDFA